MNAPVQFSTVELELAELLRTRASLEASRTIDPTQPLGDLGLDSLSLLEFVSAVEKRYAFEVPDDLWTSKEKVTLQTFATLVQQCATTHAPREVSETPHPRTRGKAINRSYPGLIAQYVRERGVAGTVQWIGSYGGKKLTRRFYRRTENVLLVRDLTRPLPDVPAPGLVIRELKPAEFDRASFVWAPHRRRQMRSMLDLRTRKGYLCLAAWSDEEVVGVDWVSFTGDSDASLGLTIRTDERGSYGMSLYERYEGRGIGMALLRASLAESRARGCEYQATYVRATNTKMVSVATQVFGFQRIGSVTTRAVLGRPRSEWEVRGVYGRGDLFITKGRSA